MFFIPTPNTLLPRLASRFPRMHVVKGRRENGGKTEIGVNLGFYARIDFRTNYYGLFSGMLARELAAIGFRPRSMRFRNCFYGAGKFRKLPTDHWARMLDTQQTPKYA